MAGWVFEVQPHTDALSRFYEVMTMSRRSTPIGINPLGDRDDQAAYVPDPLARLQREMVAIDCHRQNWRRWKARHDAGGPDAGVTRMPADDDGDA